MEPYPIRFLKNLARSREIATVLFNYGFGDVLERLGLLKYLKWGKRLIFRRQRDVDPALTSSQRIRLALQDLGPTFVKFGQVLSTRPDLLPADLIDELSQLQEKVPPFDTAEARRLIEQELKKPIAELFHSFVDEPLAAGSLGQVHRAVHFDGTQLAVKVRRPRVIHDVERDLSLLMELAQLMERHVPESTVFDPVGLVNHFTRTIRREMNLRREGRTMQEFQRLFREDRRLYVPRVVPDMCTDAVLTMEFVDGLRVDDLPQLRQCGIDPHRVARDGANIFMRQSFEMGIFHGDPHPGNMRIRRDGSLVLLDYGMVGFLEEHKREQLVDMFLSIVRRDVDRAVELAQEIGSPSQPIERPLLRADVFDFIETYYGVPLDQLSVAALLTDLVRIMSNHGLRLPGDMMLLIRAIVTLEGVGRQLDPRFNLAGELAPFVEHLVKKRYDPKRIAERALEDTKKLFKAAHDLPLHLGRTLEKLSQDDLRIQLEHRSLDKLITEFDRSSNRIVVGVVTASLVVATALIVRTASVGWQWIGIPLFALSGLLGIWLVWGILRSGRL